MSIIMKNTEKKLNWVQKQLLSIFFNKTYLKLHRCFIFWTIYKLIFEIYLNCVPYIKLKLLSLFINIL